MKSSLSPAGLVLARAAGYAPAAVGREMETGWDQWLAADSFFLCFHLFPLFLFNEIRCQSALGRLFNVRGSHKWGTQVLAFILGRETLLKSNLLSCSYNGKPKLCSKADSSNQVDLSCSSALELRDACADGHQDANPAVPTPTQSQLLVFGSALQRH